MPQLKATEFEAGNRHERYSGESQRRKIAASGAGWGALAATSGAGAAALSGYRHAGRPAAQEGLKAVAATHKNPAVRELATTTARRGAYVAARPRRAVAGILGMSAIGAGAGVVSRFRRNEEAGISQGIGRIKAGGQYDRDLQRIGKSIGTVMRTGSVASTLYGIPEVNAAGRWAYKRRRDLTIGGAIATGVGTAAYGARASSKRKTEAKATRQALVGKRSVGANAARWGAGMLGVGGIGGASLYTASGDKDRTERALAGGVAGQGAYQAAGYGTKHYLDHKTPVPERTGMKRSMVKDPKDKKTVDRMVRERRAHSADHPDTADYHRNTPRHWSGSRGRRVIGWTHNGKIGEAVGAAATATGALAMTHGAKRGSKQVSKAMNPRFDSMVMVNRADKHVDLKVLRRKKHVVETRSGRRVGVLPVRSAQDLYGPARVGKSAATFLARNAHNVAPPVAGAALGGAAVEGRRRQARAQGRKAGEARLAGAALAGAAGYGGFKALGLQIRANGQRLERTNPEGWSNSRRKKVRDEHLKAHGTHPNDPNLRRAMERNPKMMRTWPKELLDSRHKRALGQMSGARGKALEVAAVAVPAALVGLPRRRHQVGKAKDFGAGLGAAAGGFGRLPRKPLDVASLRFAGKKRPIRGSKPAGAGAGSGNGRPLPGKQLTREAARVADLAANPPTAREKLQAELASRYERKRQVYRQRGREGLPATPPNARGRIVYPIRLRPVTNDRVGKSVTYGYEETRRSPIRTAEAAAGLALLAWGAPRLKMLGPLAAKGVKAAAGHGYGGQAQGVASAVDSGAEALRRATGKGEALLRDRVPGFGTAMDVVPAKLRPTAASAAGAALLVHAHPTKDRRFTPVGRF